MSQNAFDIGAPIPTVNAAVEARILSSLKTERVAASKVLRGPSPEGRGDRARLIDASRQALYASKITSTRRVWRCSGSRRRAIGYGIDPGVVAKVWRAGCIIRASLLSDIRRAFERDPGLVNLLLDAAFRDAIAERQEGWRYVLQTAVGLGIPVPAMGSSLAYYDSHRSERLPANLTQAHATSLAPTPTVVSIATACSTPNGLDTPHTRWEVARTDGQRSDSAADSRRRRLRLSLARRPRAPPRSRGCSVSQGSDTGDSRQRWRAPTPLRTSPIALVSAPRSRRRWPSIDAIDRRPRARGRRDAV